MKLFFLSLITISSYVIVACLIRSELIAPLSGFILFIILSILSLPMLTIAVRGIMTGGENRLYDALSAILLAVPCSIFLLYFYFAFTLPVINDVSTNTRTPPALLGETSVEAKKAFEFSDDENTAYLGHYGELTTYRTCRDATKSYQRALTVSKELGFSIIQASAEKGVIYATDTTRLLGFTDDIVIQVQTNPDGGSLIDMRSRSRVGKSDLGANAKRIRRFLSKL